MTSKTYTIIGRVFTKKYGYLASFTRCDYIAKKCVGDSNSNFIRTTVYHELLHAIYGCNHVKGCPIMSAVQPDVVANKSKSIEIFKKYYNKYN